MVLVTGSTDTTVLVWDLSNVGKAPSRGCGHTGPITCVAASSEANLCASGSLDGTVILRELWGEVRLLRSFDLGENAAMLAVCSSGAVYAATPTRLLLLESTGSVGVRELFELRNCVALEACGDLVVVALRDQLLVFRGAALVRSVSLGDVCAVCLMRRTVLVAHSNGLISVVELGNV